MSKLTNRHRTKTARNKTAKATSRRRFLKGAAVAAAGAALAFPQISRAQTLTLKMQTSWNSGDVYQDMARQYIERVEAMSGGRLKVSLFAAGGRP
jgi:TRAP-type mannitol/chloroaromatic compound transport system substrate-binding protein